MKSAARPSGSTGRAFACLEAEVESALRALVERLVDAGLPPDPDAAAVAAGFSCLYDSAWEELSLIFGRRGSRLLFERALVSQPGGERDAPPVEVGEEGVVLRDPASPPGGTAATGLREDLTVLLLSVLDVLCNMIGPDLTGRILLRVGQRAEERGQEHV